MASTRFPEPVVVWLDPSHTDFGVTLVADVPGGLSALHRFSLNETLQGPDALLWQSAAGALVQADVEPTPGNVRRACEAFLRLVKRVAPVPKPIRRRVAPRTLRERVGLLF